MLTIASATQDMAIDAYTVALVGREEQGPADGVARFRVPRGAGPDRAAAWSTLAYWLPWNVLFWAAARRVRRARPSRLRWIPRLDVPAEARRHWLAPFVGWIGTWRADPARPLRPHVQARRVRDRTHGQARSGSDRGRSLLEIGLVPTALGIGLSIAGALAGGAFMQRYGTLTALLGARLPRPISNLGYTAVAQWGSPGPPCTRRR